MSQIFTFNKAGIEANAQSASQWNHLLQRRDWARKVEENFQRQGNAAALLPTDAYRELDGITQRVVRNDEGQSYMDDLMPLAKALPIGKTLMQYRVSSDIADEVTRSMGGRVPDQLQKVNYDFEGDPVGIFATGTVREWREAESFRSEGFDAMADDMEARTASLKQNIAQYMLTGDATLKVNGFEGQGIKNHRNTDKIDLGAAGFNIDLTSASTTNDDIIKFFVQDFGSRLDANYVEREVSLWVSPQMMRRFEMPYADAGGFQDGRLIDYILRLSRIDSIKRTYELDGNEWFGFVRDQRYIRPLVGMAIGTFQVPRNTPFDNHQILGWGAYGLQVRKDFNGRTGVFYASAIT